MEAALIEEQRIQKRKSVSMPVRIKEPGYYHEALTADISVGGIALFVGKEDIQPGETYLLSFDLPVRGKLRNIEAKARVVHTEFHGSFGYKVGLRFTDIDTLNTWTVESFMESSGNLDALGFPILWAITGDKNRRGDEE